MKIPIKGVIVPNEDKWIYEWFEVDATSPKDVTDLIDSANGEDLDVEINSPGGDVYSGSEIYTALKSYKGKVITNIVGVAASAAGVIAMAGNPARISPTAQLMLHNVSGTSYGDYRVLQHDSEIFKNFNISIANAYRLKSGMDESKLLALMDAGGSYNMGTWLNAQQALENKFVDEIMFDEGQKLVASANVSTMLPPTIISKLKNYLKRLESKVPKTDDKANLVTHEDLLAAVQLIVDKLKPKAAEPDESEPGKTQPEQGTSEEAEISEEEQNKSETHFYTKEELLKSQAERQKIQPEENPAKDDRVFDLQKHLAKINQLNERRNKRK